MRYNSIQRLLYKSKGIRRILYYKSLDKKAIQRMYAEEKAKMDTKYKAVAITVTHSPSDEFGLSEYEHETRYVIKDIESGIIVDDAQGYGYKTAQKAYAGWSYKNRNKSNDSR